MAENEGKYSGIKRIAGNKTSRKLLYFVGGISVCVIGYLAWPTSHTVEKNPNHDVLNRAPAQISGPANGKTVSPEYLKTVQDYTRQKLATAQKTGKDALVPIVNSNPSSKMTGTLIDTGEHGQDDPNGMADGQNKKTLGQDDPLPIAPRVSTAQVQTAPQQMDIATIQRMAQELKNIKYQVVPAKVTYVYASSNGDKNIIASENTDRYGSQKMLGMGNNSSATRIANADSNANKNGLINNNTNLNSRIVGGIDGGPEFKLPSAGTILYSKLLGRVHSDSNGPVLGEIEQGAFSGSRILGSFQFGEKGLMLTFNSMTVPYKDDDGEDQSETVPIKAIAVDTSHLGSAMATSIDRHIMERVGAQFGSAFLQGLGQAVAQSGSTAYSSPYGGTTVTNPTMNLTQEMTMAVGQGASQAGSIFQSIYGNQRTTIIVEKDTPFGLLFLDKQ